MTDTDECALPASNQAVCGDLLTPGLEVARSAYRAAGHVVVLRSISGGVLSLHQTSVKARNLSAQSKMSARLFSRGITSSGDTHGRAAFRRQNPGLSPAHAGTIVV